METKQVVDINTPPTENPEYGKGIDTVADNNVCYDKPGKFQKHPHYEHRTTKMLHKNNEFSEKKFQKVRHVSNQKKLKRAFKRIGRCLNHESSDNMPKEGYDKVCLILMNNYEHHKHDAKIGAMNDGYLFGLYHHRLGFKVFYLINCPRGNYPKYLQFFLFHTTENLTVFYSGEDGVEGGSHGIEFKNKLATSEQIGRLIARDSNGKCKVVFVSDCVTGGSVFDISQVNRVNRKDTSDMLSFSVNKSTDPSTKEGRRSHGIFTYYFSKVIYDDPSISAQRLVERLNGFLGRFGTSVSCDTTSPAVMDEAMYSPCQHPADPAAQDPIDYVMENEPSDPNSESNSGSDF